MALLVPQTTFMSFVGATGDSEGNFDKEGDSKDSSDGSKGDGQRATGECNG